MRHILPTIVIAQFFCTSLWFAGNAVMSDLVVEFQLLDSALGHLTSAVQFGFIVGTLVYALFTIADRFSPSRVFLVSFPILDISRQWKQWQLQQKQPESGGVPLHFQSTMQKNSSIWVPCWLPMAVIWHYWDRWFCKPRVNLWTWDFSLVSIYWWFLRVANKFAITRVRVRVLANSFASPWVRESAY